MALFSGGGGGFLFFINFVFKGARALKKLNKIFQYVGCPECLIEM